MGKKAKMGYYRQSPEGKQKVMEKLGLADFLMNTAKLLMDGQYPGSYARMIVDHVTVLEAMSKAEREKAGAVSEELKEDLKEEKDESEQELNLDPKEDLKEEKEPDLKGEELHVEDGV